MSRRLGWVVVLPGRSVNLVTRRRPDAQSYPLWVYADHSSRQATRKFCCRTSLLGSLPMDSSSSISAFDTPYYINADLLPLLSLRPSFSDASGCDNPITNLSCTGSSRSYIPNHVLVSQFQILLSMPIGLSVLRSSPLVVSWGPWKPKYPVAS